MRLRSAGEEEQPQEQDEAERHTGHPQERGDQHAPFFLSFVRSLDRTHIYNLLGQYPVQPASREALAPKSKGSRSGRSMRKSQNLPAAVTAVHVLRSLSSETTSHFATAGSVSGSR